MRIKWLEIRQYLHSTVSFRRDLTTAPAKAKLSSLKIISNTINMQTIAVFATILAAASAATVIQSQRLGGNFAYSTVESQPAVYSQYLSGVPVSYSSLSGVPLTYSSISGVPVSSLNGLVSNVNGVPVVSSGQLQNVAVVRSSDGAVVSGIQGLQNVVVPATSTVVSNVGTPASTAKISEVNTPVTLSNVGVSYVPVSNLGYSSVVLAKK